MILHTCYLNCDASPYDCGEEEKMLDICTFLCGMPHKICHAKSAWHHEYGLILYEKTTVGNQELCN